MFLYQILTSTIHEKKSNENNKLKISTPTWNEKFESPDGSYSVADIQVYFQYIIKNKKSD